jgi:DNA repair exonuclease SbcCD ATPase subunit
MILERFEIENWSCIRRVAVTALPAAGVVVLHGPNGTGKSSIVAALRATLFDFQPASTKAELKRYLPNWTDDAPRVTVGLKADGKSYRVTKPHLAPCFSQFFTTRTFAHGVCGFL